MSVLITSPSNPKVKEIVQLLTKAKARKSSGLCVVEGVREISRALDAGWKPVTLWNAPHSDGSLNTSFSDVIDTNAIVFEKIAYRHTTEQAVATFQIPQLRPEYWEDALQKSAIVLVLEGIEKPGNLGAVLRTAYAAGVKAILLADPALDPFGPNVMRNATGAIFAQPLFVGTSEEVQDLLARSGFTTFITHMHKDSVSMLDTQWPSKTAIVLGEESQGLSSNWLNKGYINTIIPMDGTLVDSLNVSVAAAVLLYHHKAQKG